MNSPPGSFQVFRMLLMSSSSLKRPSWIAFIDATAAMVLLMDAA